MIGIVSHLGGLRERVRSGIEVIATDKGSRVAVRSPQCHEPGGDLRRRTSMALDSYRYG